MVCRLPLDGALAVVCDACLEEEREIIHAICGPVWLGGRVAISELQEDFNHHLERHEELERAKLN